MDESREVVRATKRPRKIPPAVSAALRADMLAAGQRADLSHNRLAEIVAFAPGVLDFSSLRSATRLRSCDKALRVLVAEFAWGSVHGEAGPPVKRLEAWKLCFPAATSLAMPEYYGYFGSHGDPYNTMQNQVRQGVRAW